MSEEFGVAVLGTGWVAGEHIKAFAGQADDISFSMHTPHYGQG